MRTVRFSIAEPYVDVLTIILMKLPTWTTENVNKICSLKVRERKPHSTWTVKQFDGMVSKFLVVGEIIKNTVDGWFLDSLQCHKPRHSEGLDGVVSGDQTCQRRKSLFQLTEQHCGELNERQAQQTLEVLNLSRIPKKFDPYMQYLRHEMANPRLGGLTPYTHAITSASINAVRMHHEFSTYT